MILVQVVPFQEAVKVEDVFTVRSWKMSEVSLESSLSGEVPCFKLEVGPYGGGVGGPHRSPPTFFNCLEPGSYFTIYVEMFSF